MIKKVKNIDEAKTLDLANTQITSLIKPQELKVQNGITHSSEPHQIQPKYIGPVVWLAGGLILSITAIATYLAIYVASGISYPYILLFISLIGAWLVLLAYLGKTGKISFFGTTGKKSSSGE